MKKMRKLSGLLAMLLALTMMLSAVAENPSEDTPMVASESAETPTEAPKAEEKPEATEAPEAQATQEPEATEAPDATETPEATADPEATAVPEATEVPQAQDGARALKLQASDFKVALCPDMTLEMLESILGEDIRPVDTLTLESYKVSWKPVDASAFRVDFGTYEFEGTADLSALAEEERASLSKTPLRIRVRLDAPDDGLFYADGFTLRIESKQNKTLTITDYELNEKNLIIPHKISGNNSLPDFKLEGWTIEGIGREAFADSETLESVTILTDGEENTESLKRVDELAFAGCSALKSVELPDTMAWAENAFEDCAALSKVKLVVTRDAKLSELMNSSLIGNGLTEVEVIDGTLTVDCFYDESALKLTAEGAGEIVTDEAAMAAADEELPEGEESREGETVNVIIGARKGSEFAEKKAMTISYGDVIELSKFVYKVSIPEGFKPIFGFNTTSEQEMYKLGENTFQVKTETEGCTVGFDGTYTLKVEKKDISELIDNCIPPQLYIGEEICPELEIKGGNSACVIVKDGTPRAVVYNAKGVTLVKDTDYSISFENNTNCGLATYTVTGIGNYTGTYTGTFGIGTEIIEPKEGETFSKDYDKSDMAMGISGSQFGEEYADYVIDEIRLPSANVGIYKNVSVILRPKDTDAQNEEIEPKGIVCATIDYEIKRTTLKLKCTTKKTFDSNGIYSIEKGKTLKKLTWSTAEPIEWNAAYKIEYKKGNTPIDEKNVTSAEGTYTLNPTSEDPDNYTVEFDRDYTIKVTKATTSSGDSSSGGSSSGGSSSDSSSEDSTEPEDDFDYTYGRDTAYGRPLALDINGTSAGYLVYNRDELPLPFDQEDVYEDYSEEELAEIAAAKTEDTATDTETAEVPQHRILVIEVPTNKDEDAEGDTYMLETTDESADDSVEDDAGGFEEDDTTGPNTEALEAAANEIDEAQEAAETYYEDSGELIDYTQPRIILSMKNIRALRAAEYDTLLFKVGNSAVRVPLKTLYAQFMDVDVVVDVKNYEIRLWELEEENDLVLFDASTDYRYKSVLTPRHFEMLVNLVETDAKPDPDPIDILSLMKNVRLVFTAPTEDEIMDDTMDDTETDEAAEMPEETTSIDYDAEDYLLVGVNPEIEEPLLSADPIRFDDADPEDPEAPRTVTMSIRKGGDYAIVVVNEEAVADAEADSMAEYSDFGADVESQTEV